MPSFKRRLDILADTMAVHGLGQSYCSCPNSDVVGAKQFIMQKLLPEVECVEKPQECLDHRPRPSSVRPRKSCNLELGKFFPDGLSELGEMTREMANLSFAEAFLLLPVETRLERIL